MSKLEKHKEKARSLEGKDPKGAIEAWVEILKGQEEDPDPNPDLAIFNRIGDLYLKLREPAQAAGAAGPTAPKIQAHDDPAKSGKRKTSSLVFLDVDAPPVTKTSPVKGRAAPPSPPPPPPPARPVPEPEPVAESLIESVTAEPDTSLEIESTSLGDALEPTTAGERLEGFETTIAEFGDIQLDARDAPSLRDEISPEDIPPPAEFEPTVAEAESAPESVLELEPLPETEIEIEAPRMNAPPPVAPVVPKRPGVGAPTRLGEGACPKAPEPHKVMPVVPQRT